MRQIGGEGVAIGMPVTREGTTDYAVVGMGTTGLSCIRFLRSRGISVVAMDSRATPPFYDELRSEYPDLKAITGCLDEEILRHSDRIILSPGVALDEPALKRAKTHGAELLGDIQLFTEHARAPIIAITGTNGKSTVTSLVTAMLRESGYVVSCGGNLGPPALELISDEEPDCYVLELSSFQLEITRCLAPRIACILNVSPDHLDRHASFDSYVQAKARILDGAEFAVLNADDENLATLSFSGKRIDFTSTEPTPDQFGLQTANSQIFLAGPDITSILSTELRVTGLHNILNGLASLAICSAFGADSDAIIEALKNFEGLEHRAEYVATIGGITFINDSKATNPGASCAAIEGLCAERRGVLIAGGESKGSDFREFSKVVCRYMHTIVLLGTAATAIAESIGNRIPTLHATDMRAAVLVARKAAQMGEIVLLSPACASFDMYENFEARGRAFRQAVNEFKE